MPTLQSSTNQYLFVPGTPTPNGGLHLGHIGGPFLKLDVLARSLKMRGSDAVVISGSDSYESYVTLKAAELDQLPESVARHFHQEICRDAESLDIRFDEFIDLTESEHEKEWRRLQYELLDTFRSADLLQIRPEQVLYSPRNRRYIVGCWLLGDCPECGSSAGGFSCEDCGAFFLPSEMKNPRPRMASDTEVVSREVKSLWLRIVDPSKLLKHVHDIGIEEKCQSVIARYLSSSGPWIRLSQPGNWGVAVPPTYAVEDSVLFSYTIGQFAYALLVGKRWATLRKEPLNAFSSTSQVTTVASGGFDNTVCNIVGNIGIHLAAQQYKQYSYMLGNYFIYLEGGKFSTSRNHVIRPRDLIALREVDSDLTRFFLCSITPDRKPTDFRTRDFAKQLNERIIGPTRELDAFTRGIVSTSDQSDSTELQIHLIRLLKAQESSLSLNALDLPAAVQSITLWLSDTRHLATGKTGGWSPAWLRGLALLAYPFMPQMSKRIWTALGLQGEPRVSDVSPNHTDKPRQFSFGYQLISEERIASVIAGR